MGKKITVEISEAKLKENWRNWKPVYIEKEVKEITPPPEGAGLVANIKYFEAKLLATQMEFLNHLRNRNGIKATKKVIEGAGWIGIIQIFKEVHFEEINMKAIIKNLKKQLEKLRELIQAREDKVDDMTIKWQELDVIEEWIDKTQDFEEQADELDTIINNLITLK